MRKYSVEEEPAQEAFERRPLVIFLDLPPRRFDQPAVLDSRRARRLASAAVETQVDVPDKTLAQRQPSALHLDHLVDPAARRVHLDSQLAICRTTIQAKTAVNTLRIELPARRLAGTVGGRGGIGWLSH